MKAQHKDNAAASISDYLHIDYLNELATDKQVNFDSFVFRLNRKFLKLIGCASNIDLFSGRACNLYGFKQSVERQEVPTNHHGMRSLSSAMPPSTSSRRVIRSMGAKYYIISRLISIIFIILTLHLLTNVIYQYACDFDILRLRKLNANSNNNATKSKDILDIESRLDRNRRILYTIGAPHSQLSISAECVYICVIFMAILMFSMTQIYYRFCRTFKLHVICDQLDYEGENTTNRRLVQTKVEEFIQSDEMYSQVLDKSTPGNNGLCSPILAQIYKNEINVWHQLGTTNNESRSLQQQQQQQQQSSTFSCKKTLLELLASGAFTPINRSYHWFNKRSRLLFYHEIYIVLYDVTLFGAVFYESINQVKSSRPLGLADMAIWVSMLFVCLNTTLMACFYGAYYTLSCADQIMFTIRVTQMVRSCININTRLLFIQHANYTRAVQQSAVTLLFSTAKMRRLSHSRKNCCCLSITQNQRKQKQQKEIQIATQEAHSPICKEILSENNYMADSMRCADKVNTNLLFVLMHYKIFVDQYQATKHSCEACLIFVTAFLMLIPLIVKLHLPYSSLIETENIRLVAIAICLITLGPANCVLIPLCYMQARCEKLNGMVSSLIAHVVEVESHPAGTGQWTMVERGERGGIYDNHLIMTLLKELRHPEYFMSRFKPRIMGLRGTFTTLLKIHFWWGLLVMSIVFDSRTSGGSSLDSLFIDPLNVF